MLITVELELDNTIISKVLRTEDVMDYNQNPYELDQTTLHFYTPNRDSLDIVESFENFNKRFSELEMEYTYMGKEEMKKLHNLFEDNKED